MISKRTRKSNFNNITNTSELKKKELKKTQEIPSGHNKDDYICKKIFATAHDNEKIPITILYKKGIKLDSNNYVLLYGYGSYGISIPSNFSTNRLSLVDRGIIYAIAHVRGGKEKGYEWYENGKLLNKKNTFEKENTVDIKTRRQKIKDLLPVKFFYEKSFESKNRNKILLKTDKTKTQTLKTNSNSNIHGKNICESCWNNT